jgi:hypothetical protein
MKDRFSPTRKAYMFYQKNLPVWERILRVAAGIMVIVAALFVPLAPWMRGLVIVSALAFAFFGFIGFCPACALYGRKLDKKQ